MTLAIAVQTNQLTFGLRLEGGETTMILLFILSALLLALVGMTVDFLILGLGGWLALPLTCIAIGILIAGGLIEKVSHNDDR